MWSQSHILIAVVILLAFPLPPTCGSSTGRKPSALRRSRRTDESDISNSQEENTESSSTEARGVPTKAEGIDPVESIGGATVRTKKTIETPDIPATKAKVSTDKAIVDSTEITPKIDISSLSTKVSLQDAIDATESPKSPHSSVSTRQSDDPTIESATTTVVRPERARNRTRATRPPPTVSESIVEAEETTTRPARPTSPTTVESEQTLRPGNLRSPTIPLPEDSKDTTPVPVLKQITNMSSFGDVDATALSLSACENIEQAISYITSLDLDAAFDNTTTWDEKAERMDIYFMQAIIFPVSLGMLLYGSTLLWPACVLASAGLGVFFVFHSLDRWARAHWYKGIDCSMKLSGSVIAALVAAMTATTFLRFGIFCLGAVAVGSSTYLVFDSFPELDIGDSSAYMDSDLSPFAWVVTVVAGILGGVMLRWKEQATLEALTAMMGAVGCAFSLHSIVIVSGGSLDRSVVFLFAGLSCIFGWRFQVKRRMSRYRTYKRLDDEDDYDADSEKKMSLHSQPVILQYAPQEYQNLERSLASMQHVLQSTMESKKQGGSGGPSSEQISELTSAINALVERMGSQIPAAGISEVAGKAD